MSCTHKFYTSWSYAKRLCIFCGYVESDELQEPQGVNSYITLKAIEEEVEHQKHTQKLINEINSVCYHEYKQYQGLTEVYQYCVKCDKKI